MKNFTEQNCYLDFNAWKKQWDATHTAQMSELNFSDDVADLIQRLILSSAESLTNRPIERGDGARCRYDGVRTLKNVLVIDNPAMSAWAMDQALHLSLNLRLTTYVQFVLIAMKYISEQQNTPALINALKYLICCPALNEHTDRGAIDRVLADTFYQCPDDFKSTLFELGISDATQHQHPVTLEALNALSTNRQFAPVLFRDPKPNTQQDGVTADMAFKNGNC